MNLKALFTLFFLFSNSTYSSEVKKYIDSQNKEVIVFNSYQKSLMNELLKLSEKESIKVEREYSFPKDIKKSRRIIKDFDPKKSLAIYIPLFGIKLGTATGKDRTRLKEIKSRAIKESSIRTKSFTNES